MPKLTLMGKTLDANPEPKLSGLLNVQTLNSYSLSATRDGGAQEITIDPPDDAIIKVEYENEVCEWLRADQFALEIGERRGPGGSIVVPRTLNRGAATRGWGEWVLKALHVIGINPLDTIAHRTACDIASHYEEKLQRGLYKLQPDGSFGKEPITKSERWSKSGPYLLFLHGTASSTKGSFGGFWSDEKGGAQASPEWNEMLKRYEDRILALEHATFSVSPAQNALDAASLLPDGATVHLISHSRGGLVGELLCLDPPTKDDLTNFEGREDQKLLLDLAEVLRTKQLQVQKFVRTACPAVGTILAGKRMDLYLNILLNVIGRIPLLSASLTYDVFKAFALELIKMRADPASLPGIEAMMPESPFIHFLNTKGKSKAADVGVIAGNFQGAGFWGKLKSYALRAYYREDNDIVVNTASMKGGMRRQAGVWEYFEQGPEVNHFHYFRNESTRSRMLKWLASPAAPPTDFARVRGATRETAKPIRENAPLVFVLPDVFGSKLQLDGEDLWPNYEALASGGLTKLGSGTIGVGGLLNNYDLLIEKLSSSYRVEPFPYDWRQSITESARSLARAVASRKDTVNQAEAGIHFVGHGMGGLVLREFARSNDDLWKELKGKGSRIILLGTPNQGSWHVARSLWGRGELVRMLSLLGRHAESEVVTTLQSFQGLLDLLPEAMLDAQPWQSCSLGHPEPAGLAASRVWREQLKDANESFAAMFYLGGTADATSCGLEDYTSDGDGQVTYELGSLPELRSWYDAERSHGDLPDSTVAVLEILARGSASNLRAQPRVAMNTLDKQDLAFREQAVFFPTEEELLRVVLGRSAESGKEPESTVRVRITHGHLREASHPVMVGHYVGDAIVSAEAQLDQRLEQRLSTRFHMDTYAGPLGTVEIVRTRDTSPRGAVVVGLGEVGELTAEKLRKSVLEAFLRYALARAEDPPETQNLQSNGQDSGKTAAEKGPRSAALTSLLIGVSAGSFLSVRDSVTAITQAALEANRTLGRRKLLDKVKIDEVEFIELYEDTAVEAAHAIAGLPTALQAELQQGERIDPIANLNQKQGGRFRKPYDSLNAGWWRRIQIVGRNESETSKSEQLLVSLSKSIRPDTDSTSTASTTFASGLGTSDCTKLVFTALTDRARMEETTSLSQSKIAEALIADSTSRVDYDENAAVALFELLVPNMFKEQARESSDMVLMVDQAAAQYPWELMTDRMRADQLPLAVQSGMIRQFKTSNWEKVSGPRGAREHNALVIGDTESGLPSLPGAQQEAQEVARLLESSGYYATPPLIKPGAGEIIRKLFSNDYRIVHLAGHGIFTLGELEHTGMVLGNGMYLSPLEFEQMRVLPELVFVNCCHLGQFAKDKRTNTDHPGALASSVAQTLIQKGVKAVIAAGWAVDDGAAREFATTFYRLMLEGRKFGEAVKRARRAAHKAGPTNTWGAYQCYGNPDFALTLRTAQASVATVTFYSRRENLDELRDIAAEARGADSPQKRRELLQRARDVDKNLPSLWRDGELLSLLGEAYRELEDLAAAITTLQEAIAHPDAGTRVVAIQELANCLDRQAKQVLTKDGVEAQKMWDEAKRLLENLNQTIGESSERLSLLGALWKRRGRAASSLETAKDAFRSSAEFYQRAYELTRKTRNEVDTYSGLNWMTVAYLSGVPQDAALSTASRECLESIRQRKEANTFWDRVAEPDALLLKYLLEGTFDQRAEELANSYQKAFGFATPNERSSVTDQWEVIQKFSPSEGLQRFIETMLAKAATAMSQAAVAAD